MQSAVQDAIENNAKTKTSAIPGLTVRIWLDKLGRVTRVKLIGSTGNPALDDALKTEVLANLVMPEAPPDDMKMPINMKIIENRPAQL